MTDFPGFSLDMGALKKAKAPDASAAYDLVILGGGPAAMSAAVYAARKMIGLAVITKDFGGQVNETSEVENWLGFTSINAKDLSSKFEEHVKSFDIPVSLGPAITELKKDADLFEVVCDDAKTYSGKTVIVATGMVHRKLNVPGEKELSGRGVAYCATCDAPFYKGKKVVVAGGGNSGFTTAVDLLKVDAEVVMVNSNKNWQADEFLKRRIEGADKVTLLDYHQITRVQGEKKVEGVVVKDRHSGDEKEISADGVFVEIGLLPNTDYLKDLVKLNERGEVVVDCNCRTSVEGVFAAGDVTTVPHKQIVISAGEGAKAALSAYDYLVNKNMI